MRKSWIMIASALIVIGLIGLIFTKFDISNKKYQSFVHEWEFSNMEMTTFSINGTSDDVSVRFVPSIDDNTHITIEGETTKEQYEQIKNTNLIAGKFILDLTGTESYYFLSFGKEEPPLSIAIATPNHTVLDQLNVTLTSGEIDLVDAVITLADLTVTSGDVNMKNSEVGATNIKATSGDIEIKDYSGILNIKTDSGDIDVNQLAGSSHLIASSGDIELEQHDQSGATLRATSGDIDVVQHKESTVTIDVTSGDVEFKLAQDFKGILNLNSNSGSIKSPEQVYSSSSHSVKIKTTSGDIKVK